MITLINGIMTALLLVIFTGIWVWAWSAHNRSTFDSMARLPLDEQPANEEDDHVE